MLIALIPEKVSILREKIQNYENWKMKGTIFYVKAGHKDVDKIFIYLVGI